MSFTGAPSRPGLAARLKPRRPDPPSEGGSVSFVVPGAARGKGRPRATRRGAYIRIYTDAETASYENLVKLAAVAAMDGAPPLEGPLKLTVAVSVAPPKASRPKTAAMLSNQVRPAKKPDLTNILKAIEDGAQGVAFIDDTQIVEISAGKLYGPTPFVSVRIETLP